MRSGATRHSYATYRVSGPMGEYLIRRNGRGRYHVAPASNPNVIGFFDFRFNRFRKALEHARRLAGLGGVL